MPTLTYLLCLRSFNLTSNTPSQPDDFPDPYTVNPRRPADRYFTNGGPGMHQCMGIDFSLEAIPEMLRVIFGLKNLRRAPGAAGTMQNFMLNVYGTDNKMYLDNEGNFGPWPGSLTVIVSSAWFIW